MYTVGLIGVEDERKRPFGRDRLRASAKTRLGGTAVALQEEIVAAMREFMGERPLLDDLALLVVTRK